MFFSLFIIATFAIYVFPALSEPTGQNTVIYIIVLFLIGVTVVLSIIFSVLRRF